MLVLDMWDRMPLELFFCPFLLRYNLFALNSPIFIQLIKKYHLTTPTVEVRIISLPFEVPVCDL